MATGLLPVFLDSFQADFSFLLGVGFANPDLAAPQWEIPAQAETFFRRIEYEARESPLIAVQIDDQTSALLRHHAIGTAAVWGWGAGHCYGVLTSDILTGLSKPVFLFVQGTQALQVTPSYEEKSRSFATLRMTVGAGVVAELPREAPLLLGA